MNSITSEPARVGPEDRAGAARLRNSAPGVRLWKDVIRTGRYVHPRRRVALHVDRARMDRWVAAFERMRRAGVSVPVTVDHSPRARDVVGRLVELRRVNDVLFGLHEFADEAAAAVARRNGVSLGIDPDFIDGT